MAEHISQRFGKRLKEVRQKAKLSQEELAVKAGLHRTYVGMIERAKRNITLSNAQKLSEALNMPLSTLLIGL